MPEESDSRRFNRYRSGASCEVVFPSIAYKGIVIDYSDGACIIIENAPAVARGTKVDVNIPDQTIAFQGEVVWSDRIGNQMKAGIRRVDKLQGSLRDFRVADLLIGICRQAKTGILTVTSGKIIKKICIDRGDIVLAATNSEDEHLGGYLLKKGKISFIELEKTSRVMKQSGKKLGSILVERCYLSPRELVHEVRSHIEEIIYSLFPVEEGTFEFREGDLFIDDSITLQDSTANVIYRGIKKVSSVPFIRKICPSIDATLNFSADPLKIYQKLDLDSKDKKMLSLINGSYTLERILSITGSSNFSTLKTICALMTVGLIHVKKEGENAGKVSDYMMTTVQEDTQENFMADINRVLSADGYPGYYESLCIDRSASYEDIDRAYVQIIRQFHPDRHFSSTAPDMKDKLLKIISNAIRAHAVLSDPHRRRDYDSVLDQKASEAHAHRHAF